MGTTVDKFGKLFKSASFLSNLNFLKMIAVRELQGAIWRYVYQAHTPTPEEEGGYRRTYELLSSVTATDIVVVDNIISFKVYLDPEKMNHFSIAGEKAKGIEPGEEVYIPPIIESGEQGLFPMPARPFLDQAIKEIEADLHSAVKNAISIELKKFNKTSYKK